MNLINTVLFAEELWVNLGVTLDQFIMLVTFMASLIFMAKDLRLGIMMLFLFNCIEVILFASAGVDITLISIATLISLVLMAFSLFMSYQGSGRIYT